MPARTGTGYRVGVGPSLKDKVMSRLTLVCTALTCCAAATSCASEGPQPTEQLARAHTLVEQADKAQAQRYAAADLQRAHDELSEAENADSQRHYDEARRFAESAAVDADVASARAAAGEAQRAARELAQTNQSLQRESERATDAAAEADRAPPPPAAPMDSGAGPH
jgi:Domain of unknown function (DUF4398)